MRGRFEQQLANHSFISFSQFITLKAILIQLRNEWKIKSNLSYIGVCRTRFQCDGWTPRHAEPCKVPNSAHSALVPYDRTGHLNKRSQSPYVHFTGWNVPHGGCIWVLVYAWEMYACMSESERGNLTWAYNHFYLFF